MRDSLVFYRSFAEAISDLDEKDQLAAFWNIVRYGLDGDEPTERGAASAVFRMAKPQIDANYKRYKNGTKGGRPTSYSKEERQEARKERNSYEYAKWRDAVLNRDNYTCTLCGSSESVEAHHMKGFMEYPDLRYKVDNGLTLCKKCHENFHKSNNTDRKQENQTEEVENQTCYYGNQTEPNCDFAKPNVNVNVNENVNVKDKKDIVGQAATEHPYKAVIDYLNDKADTAFKDQSKDSRKHIKARFDDGFCLDDFFRVIDNKVAEWKGTEMAPYLRPSTLFGTKFEAYLNQKSGGARASGGAKNRGSGNKFHNFPQRDYDCDKLVEELNGF